MCFYRDAVVVICDPKIQLTILSENTSGNNRRTKLQAIERAHRTFYPLLSHISNIHGMDTIIQKILQVKLLPYMQFGNIQATGKIISGQKIKNLVAFISEHPFAC